MDDGPSFESEIWQYYQQEHPGEVQAIGIDLFNGTTSQLTQFRDLVGATFPLLLNGSNATGGNVSTLYGDRDNYVVISKQGIVRYHAELNWPYGGRYRMNEIRATIDSLVTPTASVYPDDGFGALRLTAAPNPFSSRSRIDLALPRAIARVSVTVLDVGGRRVATLHDGPLEAGIRSFPWDGLDFSGARSAAGVYLVRADLGDRLLTTRVVRLP